MAINAFFAKNAGGSARRVTTATSHRLPSNSETRETDMEGQQIQCINCRHRNVRNLNPDYMADNIARICFANTPAMTNKAETRLHYCPAFDDVEKYEGREQLPH